MNGTSRGITKRALAALVMLTLGLGTALVGYAGTAQAAPKKEHKVYICKYVSKPGEAERLQSGQNPIFTNWTSVPGATSYADVQVGDEFADKHGRSVVIAKGLKQDPEPTVADCPQPEEPDTDTESEFRAIEGEPDCEAGTVPFYEETRTRTVTDEVPGEWSEWTKIEVSDDTRPLTEEEEEACPDIAGKDTEFDEDRSADCESGTVTTTSRFRQGTETAPGSGVFEYGPWQEGETDTRDMTPAELDDCESGGPGGGPGDGEVAGDAEVLGIEANAPAAAPTAVDAGVIAEQSGSDTTSWLLAGAALALMGAALGLTPTRARGKRAR